MKAKDYLEQVEKFDTILKQKKQELADLRMMADGIGSIDYSKERVKGSGVRRACFEKPLERIDELEQEIINESVSFADKKHEVINSIQRLSSQTHIRILFEKYIQLKRLTEIASEMSYSYEYICRMHGKALAEFKKIYEMS